MALSDTRLKSLKGKPKRYEVADEKGMFAEVMSSGAIAFRYRYWLNGRKQKVTIGAYPETSLKRAREILAEYRALVEAGKSPARHKQAEKQSESEADTFKEFAEAWCTNNPHSGNWLATQRYWLELDVYPSLGSRKIGDITAGDVLTLLDSIKKRGSPQSALRVRGIIKQVYDYAIGRQRATINPASQIPSKVIHKPQSRSRTLAEAEIRAAIEAIDETACTPQSKRALKLILMTLVRKGELRNAQWQHIDFTRCEWHIPETKNGKAHIVYLSSQAIALLTELKTLAGSSAWVLPSRADPKKRIGETTLNAVLYSIEQSKLRKKANWTRFTVHDLRRTASTLLHEQGFDPLVVEKALNHTVQGVAGVYNRAQYAEQRREMLQHWADYLDAVIKGGQVVAFRRRA